MGLANRRFLLLIALLLAAVLLGRWTLHRDDAARPAGTALTSPEPQQAEPVQAPATAIQTAEKIAPEKTEHAGPSGTFRGRVIDAVTREPVVQFVVQFHGTEEMRRAGKVSGAREFQSKDGRFEWPNLPAGQWLMTASAAGYQRFDLANLEISDGATSREVVLPMRPGFTLRGRVYDEASQNGIASATISFRESRVGRFEGNFRMRPRITSEKDGSFVFDGVPAGDLKLSVAAKDYASREIVVLMDEDTAPVQIGLSTGGTISGYLTAADGATPVAGTVSVFKLDKSFSSGTRTGEDGQFAVRNLPAGRYKVMGEGQVASGAQEIVLAENQRVDGVVVKVSFSRSIRGTITGLRPEDLPRVSVWVQPEGQFSIGESRGRVDERGGFVVAGVSPGRVRVVADLNMRSQVSRSVEMPAESDMNVNLDFPRGSTLNGRVTREGKPVARVWLDPQPVVEQANYNYGAATSAQGDYVIEGLADGDYTVWVANAYPARVRIAGDTVLNIEIPRAQMSGRVLAEGGKVPIVGADVDLWPAESPSKQPRVRDSSDHFGQFELVGIEPGDFILSIYQPGYEMHRERISYSSPVSDLIVRLRPDKGVQVKVRTAGTEAPVRQVFAMERIGSRNGSRLQLQLDESGIGHLPRALAGSTLTFSALGFTPVVITSWNGGELDLKLQRAGANPP